MRCAIMQPTYIPWIGYFDLMDQVDTFVFLDNVQLIKRSWQVRNRIKAARGELNLTIPIKKTKARDETLLCDALIDFEGDWQRKHLKSIELAYKKASHFDEIFSFIEELVCRKEKSLSEFTINIIKKLAEKMNMRTELKLSSNMQNIAGKKDSLLVSICETINATEYLSPKGSAVYIEKDSPGGEFPKKGIGLFYHEFEHPVYDQCWDPFLPYMSIVDLLFNYGFDSSLEVIRTGRRRPIPKVRFNGESVKGLV